MKYVAKYVPLEGDIKKGEAYINPAGVLWPHASNDIPAASGMRRAKIVLCDKLTEEEIGNVSPKVDWVREGMEFDEVKEVVYCKIDGKWTYVPSKEKVKERIAAGDEVMKICKIKCKTCGTFH